jgi:hypothetical protein
MRVVCTSKNPVPSDPTVAGDVPPHVALSFGADTAGLDPSTGPVPTASVSLTLPADEAEGLEVGRVYELKFEEAPVAGTVDGERDVPADAPATDAQDAFAEQRAEDGVSAAPAKRK